MSPTQRRKVKRTVKKVQEHTERNKTMIHWAGGAIIGWHLHGLYPGSKYILQLIGNSWAWAMDTVAALGGGMVLVSLIMAVLAWAKFFRKDK